MEKRVIDENSFLSIKDIQQCLKCGKSFAYNLVHQNDFPKIIIGRKILIPRDEFDKWINKYLYKKYSI